MCTLVLLAWSVQGIAEAPVLYIDPFEEPATIDREESSPTGNQVSQFGLWSPELRGTMRSASGAMADIDGQIISVGEEVEGYRLVDVRERSAIFVKYGKEYVITMDEPGN
jgi:hypothetical protein